MESSISEFLLWLYACELQPIMLIYHSCALSYHLLQYVDIRLCIISDPVERFISAYINRVVHRKQMPYVDFDNFVENFPVYYKKHGSINWHLSQQSRFIGNDMSYYTHIYDVSEISKVAKLLTDLSGTNVNPIREQSSKKYEKPILTKDQI